MSSNLDELLGDFQREKTLRNPLLDKARRDKISPDDFKDKRKTGRDNSWQVTELQELHQEIKRLIFLGKKNVDIAELLDCSPSLVSSVKNSPIIKEELALMNASADSEVIELNTRVATLAPKALKNIEECVDSGTVNGEIVDVKTILAESNKVLDREMGKPTQNVNTQNAHLHFTPEDLQKIKDNAMKNCAIFDVAEG